MGVRTWLSKGRRLGRGRRASLYRDWGASVVGMTAFPEAKLAREAELCYALLTTVTDYDSWHPDEAAVDAADGVRRVAGERRAFAGDGGPARFAATFANVLRLRPGAGRRTADRSGGDSGGGAHSVGPDPGAATGGNGMTLLVTGWVAMDDIETPFESRKRVLGGPRHRRRWRGSSSPIRGSWRR